MAASLSYTQRKEDFKDEFLTCSICTEPYDNDKRMAKYLPCLHTYCKSCLQSIAGKRPTLDCPKCRKLISLPRGTVDGLPNNFIVENLKEYQGIFNSSISCGSCIDDPAASFCHDCGLFLCQKCIDAHRQFGPHKQHKLLTLAELQEKKYNPLMQQQQHCLKHQKQDMTMYCTESNCKVPVCATCGLLDHRGHDLVELSVAIAKVIDDMHLSTARVRQRSQELACKRVAVESLQETLTTNFKKKEKEMQESAQKLKNQINTCYSKAHTHLKKLYEAEMTNVTASIESIDFLATQMISACEFADKSSDMSHPTQILTSQNQIMERLNELEISELPETSSDKSDFNFTEKHHLSMAQIQESLQDLYDLGWMQRPQQKKRIKGKDRNQKQSTPARDGPTSAVPARKPQVDPRKCTIQLKLQRTGKWGCKAIVQTVDKKFFGHKMSTGGAKVEATQDGCSCDVQDNNDGTYTFDYSILLGSIHVKINGTEMKGSPFSV
ncbi:E3 ubiquitin-protein ligase TRIM56-like [Amphiura filiformis]|uniref:E3 ubiquitin-protein ligase TRIM56-like n=1 Tax=Amphiura filiformis TaxID=82378 RepID=UPI003B21A94E